MAKIYRSYEKSYLDGDIVHSPLITRDNNMMAAFMRVYHHRYGKAPCIVTTKRKDGVKTLWAAAPNGWLVMYFDGYERKAA